MSCLIYYIHTCNLAMDRVHSKCTLKSGLQFVDIEINQHAKRPSMQSLKYCRVDQE